MATAAFAQGEGGDAPADDSASAAPAGGDAAPADDTAAPSDDSSGGGDAAKSDDKSADKSGGDTGASAAASASTADSGGKIKIGLRLGYALPLGDSAKGVALNKGISGMIPIWLDAGYMVTPNIMVGLYGQYGIVMVKDCPSGASCSGSDMRFGLQGQYHIMPAQSMDPWFGLGIGYEIANGKQSVGSVEASGSTSGFEFANLQGGLDFKAGPVTVGPFVSFSLGQYSNASSKVTGQPSVSGSIQDKAIHEWLTFGVKGTFGF